jgi:hypothetical protein
MKVPVGQPIPFWFKLWDGNSTSFVRAHVTDSAGAELPGSPYPLTYVQRGIYTGLGPTMINDLRVVDYEVFIDDAFTEPNKRYLTASDWVEPDTSVAPASTVVILRPPFKGKLSANTYRGSILAEPYARATVLRSKLVGFISIPKFMGNVSATRLEETL